MGSASSPSCREYFHCGEKMTGKPKVISINSNRRFFLFFVMLTLILLAGCLQEKFSGIAPNPNPAPNFTLTNQLGEQVSLTDLRGKIVVMSFLYTSCPTVCPLITSKFIEGAKMLGESAGTDVIFVAVSVDPERDTPDKLRKYVKDKGLEGKMQFLTGKKSALENVWRDYNIYVNRSDPDENGNYTIDHTAIVYVVDKKGNLRVMYPGLQWYPKFLVGDIKTVLKEDGFLYRVLYDIPQPEV
jgi:protein SCO1/2